jgi:hypothetical protein
MNFWVKVATGFTVTIQAVAYLLAWYALSIMCQIITDPLSGPSSPMQVFLTALLGFVLIGATIITIGLVVSRKQ